MHNIKASKGMLFLEIERLVLFVLHTKPDFKETMSDGIIVSEYECNCTIDSGDKLNFILHGLYSKDGDGLYSKDGKLFCINFNDGTLITSINLISKKIEIIPDSDRNLRLEMGLQEMIMMVKLANMLFSEAYKK